MKNEPSNADLNRSRLVTDAVLKEITDKIVAPVLSKEQQLIERANTIAKQCFNEFARMHNIQVVPMKKDDAAQHIAKLYREKYRDWSKDDLLDILSLTMSVLAVESYHDELI